MLGSNTNKNNVSRQNLLFFFLKKELKWARQNVTQINGKKNITGILLILLRRTLPPQVTGLHILVADIQGYINFSFLKAKFKHFTVNSNK